jgi:tyrosinase
MKFDDLLSRRDFVKGLGLAGTFVVLAYTGGCEQLIEIIENRPTRRNIGNMTATDPTVVSYKAAVTAMKNLFATSPADQRNWINQALIHNNHCPHGNWYFLPWHRAYLLYFERICRKYSGDNNFALPFWNWTSNPTVPAVFWDGTPGTPCSAPCPPTSVTSPGNPLFDCSRQVGPNDPMPVGAVGQDIMETILSQPNFFLFASAQAVGQRDRAGYGQLEGTPHNTVHGMIGGYMGAFCSPIDPVFWTHHCMIDACWVNWNITRGNPNTNDANWVNFPLVDFVDENNNPVNIPIVDTLLYPLLAYQYEPTQMGHTIAELSPPSLPGLDRPMTAGIGSGLSLLTVFLQQPAPPSPTPLTKADAKALHNFLKKGAPVKLVYSKTYDLAQTLTVQVGHPASGSIKIEPAAVRPALDVQTSDRVILTVSGITMPTHADHFVRVFLNKPDASPETPISDPHYAGSFAFFVDEHAMNDGMTKAGFVVDTTEALRRLNEAGALPEQVEVQLVAVPYAHRTAEGEGFKLEKLELGIAPPPNVAKLHLSR